MERLHPMMKYGNFIDVYNNVKYHSSNLHKVISGQLQSREWNDGVLVHPCAHQFCYNEWDHESSGHE